MSNLYKVTAGASPITSDINQLIDALNGAFDISAITPAPQISAQGITGVTAAAVTGTALGIGAYIYKCTYVVGYKKSDNTFVYGGETRGCPAINVTTTSGNQAVSLSGLPTTWPATAIALRIYRTAVGGADGTQKLVATLNAPVSTYSDTTADASLGSAIPTVNTTGLSIGGTNADTVKTPALAIQTDTRTVNLTYDGNGNLTSVTEVDPTNSNATVRTTTLTYDGSGNLTSVAEATTTSAGATVTVTTTLNYTSGNLSSVTKAVS